MANRLWCTNTLVSVFDNEAIDAFLITSWRVILLEHSKGHQRRISVVCYGVMYGVVGGAL